MAWPNAEALPPGPQPQEHRTSRILQTTVTQRIEHHGSACAIHESRMQASSPQFSQRPHNPKLTYRVVQRTQTSLNE